MLHFTYYIPHFVTSGAKLFRVSDIFPLVWMIPLSLAYLCFLPYVEVGELFWINIQIFTFIGSVTFGNFGYIIVLRALEIPNNDFYLNLINFYVFTHIS
jgi:hypothetical protein